MDHQDNVFIHMCRFIAETDGTPGDFDSRIRSIVACEKTAGHISMKTHYDDFLVYQDEHIRIVIEMRTLCTSITNLGNNNSVVVLDEKGGIIRWHGEASQLYSHARKLVFDIVENWHNGQMAEW